MKNLRMKFLGGDAVQLRVTPGERSGAPMRIAGYASVFGIVDLHGDVVEHGAFARTLKAREWPVQMYANHRIGAVGRWTELREDDYGLFVAGELTPGHSVANDLAASIAHGATAGLSIAFTVPDGGATIRAEGGGFILRDVDLWEISVVDMPANTAAEILDVRTFREEALRRDIEAAATLADVERALCRHCGLGRRDARDLSGRFKELLARELEDLRAEINGVRSRGAVLRELEKLTAFAKGAVS